MTDDERRAIFKSVLYGEHPEDNRCNIIGRQYRDGTIYCHITYLYDDTYDVRHGICFAKHDGEKKLYVSKDDIFVDIAEEWAEEYGYKVIKAKHSPDFPRGRHDYCQLTNDRHDSNYVSANTYRIEYNPVDRLSSWDTVTLSSSTTLEDMPF